MTSITKIAPIDNEVVEIVKLIETGAESWIRAGKMITDLRSRHPEVYQKLTSLRPWITLHLLHTLERIGKREVYPYVLLEPSSCAKWLLGYSYDEQERACTQGVDVLLYVKGGKPFVQRKPIRELSRLDAKRVFGPHRLRKPDEQIPFLSEPVKKINGNHVLVNPNLFNQNVQNGHKFNLPPPVTQRTQCTESTESTESTQRPPPNEELICLGRWVVRQQIGNNVGFERTTAKTDNMVRVILNETGTVIEICRRKKPAA